MTTVFDFSVSDADGGRVELSDYAGRAMLITNVASRCGFTPQYEGLEQLNMEFRDLGLQVLGFPCNQFGEQEPGSSTEILQFCSTNYGVTFPVLGKIEVNGPGAEPLFAYLRAQAPGDFTPETVGELLYDHVKNTSPESIGTDAIKWNFTKFLVDRSGRVVRRYESAVTPEAIHDDISAVLAQ